MIALPLFATQGTTSTMATCWQIADAWHVSNVRQVDLPLSGCWIRTEVMVLLLVLLRRMFRPILTIAWRKQGYFRKYETSTAYRVSANKNAKIG